MNFRALASPLVAAVALAACPEPAVSEGEGKGEGEGEGDPGSCPISPLARQLLEQSVNELFVAAAFATTNTHGDGVVDLGYGADLVGLDVGVLQIATLAFPCTEPTTFDPTCETTFNPEPSEDPFFDDHDRCFRLGCAGADQPLVDVYFTMRPNTSADERHAFTTETTTPAGTSTYAENPLVRWVADVATPDIVTIHSDVAIAHVFSDGSETGDVGFSGTVDGTYVVVAPDDQVTLDLTLTFPALDPSTPVAVEVHGDEAGALSGSITHDGAALAALDGEVNLGAPLPFQWIAECE